MASTPEDRAKDTGNPPRAGDSPDRTGWQRPLPEELPEPTPWPAALALGSCLLAWGVVTSWILSLVGLLLFVVGVAGWMGRMRHEHVE